MQTTVSHLTDDSTSKATWIRLPRPGLRCPHTGLSRSTLLELCVPRGGKGAPHVKSVVILKPGAIRGIRLVHYASLMDYLASLVGCSTATTKNSKAKLTRK